MLLHGFKIYSLLILLIDFLGSPSWVLYGDYLLREYLGKNLYCLLY